MLEQRCTLLEEISQAAQTSGWDTADTQELLSHVWDSMVEIDNEVLGYCVETSDEGSAKLMWVSQMGKLLEWVNAALDEPHLG